MRFGSDELHQDLRKAYDAGDLEYAGLLLHDPVVKTARMLFARFHDHFSMYSPEDREDAIQNAQVYMLEHLKALAYPKEEGTPNFTYYSNFVLSGLRNQRHKIIRDSHSVSMDAPISSGTAKGDDKERTLGDITPAKQLQPDQYVLKRDSLHTVLNSFFQLKNDPATIASVAYIILNEALGGDPMSMDDYATFFNGSTVTSVVDKIESILILIGQDVSILAPLRRRLAAPEPLRFANVTYSKLANRKNSVLNSIRRLYKFPE